MTLRNALATPIAALYLAIADRHVKIFGDPNFTFRIPVWRRIPSPTKRRPAARGLVVKALSVIVRVEDFGDKGKPSIGTVWALIARVVINPKWVINRHDPDVLIGLDLVPFGEDAPVAAPELDLMFRSGQIGHVCETIRFDAPDDALAHFGFIWVGAIVHRDDVNRWPGSLNLIEGLTDGSTEPIDFERRDPVVDARLSLSWFPVPAGFVDEAVILEHAVPDRVFGVVDELVLLMGPLEDGLIGGGRAGRNWFCYHPARSERGITKR